MKKQSGYLATNRGRIFYSSYGQCGRTPILVLHGGPGIAHDYLEGLSKLGTDRQVIFYDQLGAGKSDRPNDESLWTIERYTKELEEVRHLLGLEQVILYGASGGTMLAVDYLLGLPVGVRAALLSNPCLSAALWRQDTLRLLRQFPETIRNAIARHEAAGTTDSTEYQDAILQFVRKHICRIDPTPEVILRNARLKPASLPNDVGSK